MKSASILILCVLGLFLTFHSASCEEVMFQEQPGVLEFSGLMIARPLQADALASQGLGVKEIARHRDAAAARLDAWRIRSEPLLDIHILRIPEGSDENSFSRALMATGDYEYVEPNWRCFPVDNIPNDPLYNQQWHHPKMNSPKAWDLHTGDAFGIAAFVDTGVDKDHEDLIGHLLSGYNSADRLPESQGGKVDDINGHGTWVAGCIGATGNNSKGVAGMNWIIGLLPIRTTNNTSGGANMDDLIDGSLWAAQNGAKSISVSYTGVSSSVVGTTGTQIKNMDALLIWAAGNASSDLSGFDWDDVIVAGATDQNDNMASFSNYGQAIDVMAPGVDIMSTKNGGGYSDPSGTSFSAPLTNGACALAWAYSPSLTADEVEQALFDGCMDMGNSSLYGHGRVDVYEALLLALPALSLHVTAGLPSGIVPPGPAFDITLEITAGFENYVPGSGMLHYRFDSSDPYSTVGVTPLGGDLFEVTLPNTVPGDEPEFYFSAQGDGGTTVYSPSNAPATVYSCEVMFVDIVFHDDFESSLGWTVENQSVATGEFERADPAGTDAQPEDDHSEVGTMCFVTGKLGGSIGNDDLDGGPTDLISPAIDLSGGDASLTYYLWFYHSTNGTFTPLQVHLSNNNGTSWVLAESLTSSSPAWNQYSITVSDHVTPTSQVKIRFRAKDNPNNSVVEALVDDFTVERYNDDPSLWADTYTISVSQQTEVGMTLHAGPGYGGRKYLLLGSFSGTSPGMILPGGHIAPLNWDFFTSFIVGNLGSPLFQNFLGNLDGQGNAAATFDTLGPIDPGLVGFTVHFVFVLRKPPAWNFSSNPIALTFEL